MFKTVFRKAALTPHCSKEGERVDLQLRACTEQRSFCFLKRLAESGATSSEERGPAETQPGRKAETDRVREGISEGVHPAESGRVAPGDGEAQLFARR
jgi:hypothetical protein